MSGARDRGPTVVLSLVLAALALVGLTAVLAVMGDDGGSPYLFTSLRGERVLMYGGDGPYAYDTVDKALMQRAFDAYYVLAGIPVALAGLAAYLRRSVIGLLLLTSSAMYLAYGFLISGVGIAHNRFFLAYVAVTVLTVVASVLMIRGASAQHLAFEVLPRVPRRAVAAFVLALAAYFFVVWVVLDVQLLASGAVHPDLGIYTTAEQNFTDLTVYVSVSVWAAVLLLRRRPLGAVLSVALVLMAGQTLVTLTIYTVGRALYLDEGAAGIEWPLPIAAVACLVMGVVAVRRLRGVQYVPRDVEPLEADVSVSAMAGPAC